MSAKSWDDFFNEELCISIVATTQYFADYGKALCVAFKRKGLKAECVENVDSIDSADIILIIGPQTVELTQLKKKKALKCALFTEQMYSREIGYKVRGMSMLWNTFVESRYFNLVFDWSCANCKVISKWHPNVVHFPHSYYDELKLSEKCDKYGDDGQYDIAFIGAVFPGSRREKIMQFLSSKYNVMPISDSLWGAEKAIALKNAKIYLNLHQDEGLVTEFPRLYDYFSNHCFVLSEPMKYSDPFICGEDYDVVYSTNITSQIDFYLKNYKARKKIADNAFAKAKNESMDKNINIMINAMYSEMYFLKYKGNLWTKVCNVLRHIKSVIATV